MCVREKGSMGYGARPRWGLRENNSAVFCAGESRFRLIRGDKSTTTVRRD